VSLTTVGAKPPRRARQPVTIEVKQDVEVLVGYVAHEVRGKLYLGLMRETPFVISRGERFQMIKIDGEGECQIRFRGKTHVLMSCPWLDGFNDQQRDIFEIVRSPTGHRKP
jgi:hypothetical protein